MNVRNSALPCACEMHDAPHSELPTASLLPGGGSAGGGAAAAVGVLVWLRASLGYHGAGRCDRRPHHRSDRAAGGGGAAAAQEGAAARRRLRVRATCAAAALRLPATCRNESEFARGTWCRPRAACVMRGVADPAWRWRGGGPRVRPAAGLAAGGVVGGSTGPGPARASAPRIRRCRSVPTDRARLAPGPPRSCPALRPSALPALARPLTPAATLLRFIPRILAKCKRGILCKG